MSAVATNHEQSMAFSEYSEAMDAYFLKNEVKIKVLPDNVSPEIEKKHTDFIITSAGDFISYIEEQISYWDKYDPEKKMAMFSNISNLKTASKSFESASQYYNSGNAGAGESTLKNCIASISAGSLYYKTDLAKHLVKNSEKSVEFFTGFKSGLATNKRSQLNPPIMVGTMEGFAAALTFRKYIKEVCRATKNDVKEFSDAVSTANQNFSNLNVQSFHEQERRLGEFEEQVNRDIEKLQNESNEYFKSVDVRREELEKLYEEKLKLKAPAQYWNELEKTYKRRGGFWLGVSIFLSVVIIGMLILVITLMPDVFDETSHWFDVFKNSAIITVVTSVAVYVLRLFVKMTLSSFHLARDSKEREQLTYVYLALIEGKAVTEKERAIILNALFSRSDTGLLKGDSAPTMSSNVTDLVETLSKKQ